MTTYSTNDADYGVAGEPENSRWSGGHEIDRVASFSPPQGLAQGQNGGLTWPTAVMPGAYQQQGAGLLMLSQLIAPDMPPPPLPAWTQWPGRLHIWPAVAAGAWSGLGFWAHNEPNHAWFSAGFLTLGTVMAGLGALGTAAGNAVARDADAEPPDKAGTRGLLAAGLASISGAAATGAGFSGIGCMLAAGTVAVGYGGYFGWKRHNRNQAIQAVVAYAAASNPGPLPPGMPLPQIVMPSVRNPFEARIQGALEAMRIEGTWLGSPQRIADDVWRFPAELPAGANLSPEALAKKEAVLANNMRARRVEIEPTHGAKFVLDVYDGPDRTDETFPWDGKMVTSALKPIPIAVDDAGRVATISINEHMMVAGMTRMGKSALLRLILCATLEADDLVVIGIDCKDGAPGLGMFEPVLHKLAVDAMDGMRIQFGIKAVAAARGQLMREEGMEEWSTRYGPLIMVVIDERAELTRRYPKAAKVLESNLQLVNAAGIRYADCMQDPGKDVFGGNTNARHQYGWRASFLNEGNSSNMVFGTGKSGAGWKVENLDGKGKFLMWSLAHKRPRVRKAFWVERDVAVELVERYKNRVTQLDDLSAEAFEAGMAAFDEAMAAGLDPFEAFEPPPGGGGGRDAIDEADDFHNGRVHLSLVPTYPNSSEAIDSKHLALWKLLGEYGASGAVATELVTAELKNYTSESNTRKQMKVWEARGYVVVAAKEGRTERFARIDMLRADRREAQ